VLIDYVSIDEAPYLYSVADVSPSVLAWPHSLAIDQHAVLIGASLYNY